MKTKDIKYLNTLTDESQYPAARCAMKNGIYMYHRSSSGAVESIKKANKEMRARTAVEPLAATMLLLNLEKNRFNKQKQEAWGGDSILTPTRGQEENDITYINLSPSHFVFNLDDYDDHWHVRVHPNNVTGTLEQIARLPKVHRQHQYHHITPTAPLRKSIHLN